MPAPTPTTALSTPGPTPGWAAEPKRDGFRTQLAVQPGGRVLLRSRQGTSMTGSFPEIRAAVLTQLPADTGLDGEPVGAHRSEGASAHLAGVARIPASSGRTHHHRLNRGSDRAANNALHTIVLTRTRFDERTRAYVERRTKGGAER
ncbi:transposase [Streptomyces longwoodensis]|uniref:transposase n=1 Tax=Streptomyces longwoodensis TaxID=68231 RepID=UPI003F4CFE7D